MSTETSIVLGDIEAMQAILDLVERQAPGFLYHLLRRPQTEKR